MSRIRGSLIFRNPVIASGAKQSPANFAILPEIASSLPLLAMPGADAAAKRRVRTILAAIRRLRTNLSRYPRDDKHPGACPMVIERHVVVYEVTPDTGRDPTAGDVIVLRVFGPGQDRSAG